MGSRRDASDEQDGAGRNSVKHDGKAQEIILDDAKEMVKITASDEGIKL